MIHILYATETGTAHNYAKRLQSYLVYKHKFLSTVHDFKDYASVDSYLQLAQRESAKIPPTSSSQTRGERDDVVFVFIVSTHGLGGPPNGSKAAAAFIERQKTLVMGKEEPSEMQCESTIFEQMEESFPVSTKFCVLALGDSCHPDFAAFGRSLHDALSIIGKQSNFEAFF